MPPKKVEVIGVVDIPDQPLALDSDGVMEDLLSKAKAGNASTVEVGVVASLGLHNHKCSIRQGVLVDFHVEFLLFAAANGYGPKKTLSVLSWLNALRRSIEENNGDTTEAREQYKAFLVNNVERSLRETAQPQEAELHPEPSVAANAAQSSTAPGAKKDAKGGKPAPGGAAAKEEPTAAAKAQSQENSYITSAEVSPLAAFVLRGLFQHAQLHAFVANHERPLVVSAKPQTFTFAVETPIRAAPLNRAMTAVDVEAQQKALEVKALEDLQRLQAEEAAALEAERQAELRRQEAERLRQEEEKANQLYFSKAGTGLAVEQIQHDVEHQLSQRQRDILLRIAKLESEVASIGGSGK